MASFLALVPMVLVACLLDTLAPTECHAQKGVQTAKGPLVSIEKDEVTLEFKEQSVTAKIFPQTAIRITAYGTEEFLAKGNMIQVSGSVGSDGSIIASSVVIHTDPMHTLPEAIASQNKNFNKDTGEATVTLVGKIENSDPLRVKGGLGPFLNKTVEVKRTSSDLLAIQLGRNFEWARQGDDAEVQARVVNGTAVALKVTIASKRFDKVTPDDVADKTKTKKK